MFEPCFLNPKQLFTVNFSSMTFSRIHPLDKFWDGYSQKLPKHPASYHAVTSRSLSNEIDFVSLCEYDSWYIDLLVGCIVLIYGHTQIQIIRHNLQEARPRPLALVPLPSWRQVSTGSTLNFGSLCLLSFHIEHYCWTKVKLLTSRLATSSLKCPIYLKRTRSRSIDSVSRNKMRRRFWAPLWLSIFFFSVSIGSQLEVGSFCWLLPSSALGDRLDPQLAISRSAPPV